MAKPKLSEQVKKQVSKLLDKGLSSEEVAKKLGVGTMQVAAVKAWKTMGHDYDGNVRGRRELKNLTLSQLVELLGDVTVEFRARLQ